MPDAPVIDVETFRRKILLPILAYLDAESLRDEIDLIAYSVGFPYAVNFNADASAKGIKIRAPITRNASLTGLTYLYPYVLAKDPASYLSMTSNRYFRQNEGQAAPRANAPGAGAVAKIRSYQGFLRSKDYRKAAEVLEDLLGEFERVSAFWYDLACCRALLGDSEGAFEALEKAVAHGFDQAAHAAEDLDLESLRDDPRFQALLGKMRAAHKDIRVQASRAFSAGQAWDEAGRPVEDDASNPHYLLAVMLGWAGRHGNTVDEILASLERARESDGSQPDGTVYLLKNKDVRARTRAPLFEAVKQGLERIGHKAEILEAGQEGQDGVLPRGRDDAIGIMAGRATLTWKKGDFDLLPGAIAEHLTSFGAHFGTASQTKCTAFFPHGAAGTSGTVAEPLAIAQKFPSPWIHLHYAFGCSLAEAFYESVSGPYQLLVLGDPLTRPFAAPASLTVQGDLLSAPFHGLMSLPVGVLAQPGTKIDHLELFVDGQRVGRGPLSRPLDWDTTTVADGVHDLRIVAVETGRIATRSFMQAWVEVDNGGGFALDLDQPEAVAFPSPLLLKGKAEGLARVEILQGARTLGTADVHRGRWKLEVPTTRLGLGTSRLQVLGHARSEATYRARPVDVEVVNPSTSLQVARIFNEADALPGLRATWEDADGKTHEGYVGTLTNEKGERGRTLAQDLDTLGATGAKKLVLEGSFRSAKGVAAFRLRAIGAVKLEIGGKDASLLATSVDGPEMAFVPLQEGWHDLRLEIEGPDIATLRILVGGSRPLGPLGPRDLAHVAPEAWARAPTPAAVLVGEKHRLVPTLSDGKRGGAKGAPIDERGVVVSWKEKVKRIEAVVLYPVSGKDAPPASLAWTLESRASPRGRWHKVKKLVVQAAPPSSPPKSKKGDGRALPPRFLVIRFQKTTASALRIRPAGSEAGATLKEIEIYVAASRTRRRSGLPRSR